MVFEKPRDPLQVSSKFKKKLAELQRKIMMKKGVKISFCDLTENLAMTNIFDDIEKRILDNANVDIKIKFDRRLS